MRGEKQGKPKHKEDREGCGALDFVEQAHAGNKWRSSEATDGLDLRNTKE